MRITYTVGGAQAEFIRMKSTSKKRTPSIVNLTVKRRYLTAREVERLMDCARKHGRYGHRDATMILVAYRQASEVCDLQWQQIELSEQLLCLSVTPRADGSAACTGDSRLPPVVSSRPLCPLLQCPVGHKPAPGDCSALGS